jgi:gliding motility-associated-like protein
VKLSNVTVNTGNQIELSIEPSSGDLIPISGLEILRTGEVTDVISSPIVLSYLDNSVNTQQRSYSYKVRQVDECGGISAPSNAVNSIYLKVENDLSLYPLLTWTQERIWDTKFEQYQVFKKDNEVSVLIATVTGKLDTTYLDKTGDIECASEACYQVVAVSQDGLSSYSNSNCTGSSSALFAPNAMSPNGDGLNDVYRIRGLYISQFHFEVYTRWGEKIFETDECMQPWDGTYRGKRVPSGCYFYVVNAIGADRVRHYSNGTLTVLE